MVASIHWLGVKWKKGYKNPTVFACVCASFSACLTLVKPKRKKTEKKMKKMQFLIKVLIK